MQNGKSAVARELENGIGFGSTEFHVLRPGPKILPNWLHYLVRHKKFRDEAERHFRGTAGQQRVPKSFLENKIIVVPTIDEQRKIVAFLQKLEKSINEYRKQLAGFKRETNSLIQSIYSRAFSED